jgi:hypothetical protein
MIPHSLQAQSVFELWQLQLDGSKAAIVLSEDSLRAKSGPQRWVGVGGTREGKAETETID